MVVLVLPEVIVVVVAVEAGAVGVDARRWLSCTIGSTGQGMSTVVLQGH
jgi:hypothetical protein